jgi:hypothetical protein
MVPGNDPALVSEFYSPGTTGPATLEMPLLPGRHDLEVRARTIDRQRNPWQVLRSVTVDINAGEVTQLEY